MIPQVLELALASLLYGAGLWICVRTSSANTRAFLRGGLLGFLILPVLVLGWRVLAADSLASWWAGANPWPELGVEGDVPAPLLALEEPQSSTLHGIGALLLWLSLAGCLSFLALYLRRLLLQRRTSRVSSEALAAAFEEVCSRLGLERRARLLVTEGTHGIATIGWRRPCVLLPPRLLDELDARELKQVLYHEIGHLVRRDYLWHLLETFLRSLLCWNPFVRWAGRSLQAAQEREADRFVLERAGIPHGEYAACLARMALRPYRLPLGVSLARGSQTVARVKALQSGEVLPSPSATGPRKAWVALSLALLLSVVCAATPWSGVRRAFPRGGVHDQLELGAGTLLELGEGGHVVSELRTRRARVMGLGPGSRLELGVVAGHLTLASLELGGRELHVREASVLELVDVTVDVPVILEPGARLSARGVTWIAGLTVRPGAKVLGRDLLVRSEAPWEVVEGHLALWTSRFVFGPRAALAVRGASRIEFEDVELSAALPASRPRDRALVQVGADGVLAMRGGTFARAPLALRLEPGARASVEGTRLDELGVGCEAGPEARFEFDPLDVRAVTLATRVPGRALRVPELEAGDADALPAWRRPAWSSVHGPRETIRPLLGSAVAWLQEHQSSDGRFGNHTFSLPCVNAGCATRGRHAIEDVGTTALVLSLLLLDGRGDPEVDGALEKGFAWLLERQDPRAKGGEFVAVNLWERAMVIHALALRLHLEPDHEETRKALRRAMAGARQEMAPSGGWRYGKAPEGEADALVTAFFVRALARAEAVGFPEARAMRYRACEWARRLPRTPHRQRAMDMTPDHALARAYLRRVGEREFDLGPSSGPENMEGESPIGTYFRVLLAGDEHSSSSRATTDAVLESLAMGFETEGHVAGSLRPTDDAVLSFGRLHATAFACLAFLEAQN